MSSFTWCFTQFTKIPVKVFILKENSDENAFVNEQKNISIVRALLTAFVSVDIDKLFCDNFRMSETHHCIIAFKKNQPMNENLNEWVCNNTPICCRSFSLLACSAIDGSPRQKINVLPSEKSLFELWKLLIIDNRPSQRQRKLKRRVFCIRWNANEDMEMNARMVNLCRRPLTAGHLTFLLMKNTQNDATLNSTLKCLKLFYVVFFQFETFLLSNIVRRTIFGRCLLPQVKNV